MLTRNDYQKALDSQTASNLSGLVHSLSEVLPRIWKEAMETGKGRVSKGTDFVNQHPIVRLYVEQLMQLSEKLEYPDAYHACMHQIENRTPRKAKNLTNSS